MVQAEKHPAKSLWGREEDEALMDMVRRTGSRSWTFLARYLPGRSGKQCRERWVNHLDPQIKKDPWTAWEDAKLLELHERLGNRWVEFAKELQGRSENSIKNRWNSILKKRLERDVPSVLETTSLNKRVRVLSATSYETFSDSPIVHPSKKVRRTDIQCRELDFSSDSDAGNVQAQLTPVFNTKLASWLQVGDVDSSLEDNMTSPITPNPLTCDTIVDNFVQAMGPSISMWSAEVEPTVDDYGNNDPLDFNPTCSDLSSLPGDADDDSSLWISHAIQTKPLSANSAQLTSQSPPLSNLLVPLEQQIVPST